jgi:hypothetical protein
MLTAVAPWFPSMAACYTILVELVIYFLTHMIRGLHEQHIID